LWGACPLRGRSRPPGYRSSVFVWWVGFVRAGRDLIVRSTVCRWLVMAIVLVAAASLAVVVADIVLAPAAAPARADASTGSGGLFVDAVGRLLDTRNGTGGYSTPMPTLTWRSVAVDGQDGIPASGVSAVQVTVTAVSPAQAGIVYLAPDGVSNPPTVSNLVYDHGVVGTISNTAIVAVGSNGKIQAKANSPVNLILDVQGYYTAGLTAAGGYVPLPGARIVNTRNGTGVPQAKLAQNSTTTIQVGGRGGVPSNASAVFVTLTPTDYHPTAGGHLTVYPAGATVPTSSLNFSANISTALGAEVDLNTAGQMAVKVSGSMGSIDLIVDVVGYFTPTSTTGGFTPAATRVYDSRTPPHVRLPAGATRTVPTAGVHGVPAVGSGISAVAINLLVISSSTASGWLRLWADDQPQPSVSMMNFGPSETRSNLTVVRLGADGGIKIRNGSGGPVDFVFDVEGWYNTVGAPIKARIDNAVYDWWAQPVSVNDGAYTWVGSIAKAGTVRVAKVNRAAGTYQWATLTSVGDIYHDEHNTPALAFEDSEPNLIAFYTQHGADNIMRYRTINRTTLAVGPLKTLTFSGNITYAQVIRNGTRLMVLTRVGTSWRYRITDDFASLWSAERVLINASGYGTLYSLVKPASSNGDVNHLAVYGHPLSSTFRNVVYAQIHLQSGDVTLTNGQVIGSINDPGGPNLRPEQLQAAITPGTGFKVRLLDVDTVRGRPAIAYAIWNAAVAEDAPATYKVEMYQDNNTWKSPPWSLAAGKPFGYDPAVHYVGGMAIGRDNVIYSARESDGTWILEKWAWSESEGTIKLADVIARDSTQKLARPYVPARDGETDLTIDRFETYSSYTNYTSDILVF
jgi:hypothetical protein